jgi:hypothetical protein
MKKLAVIALVLMSIVVPQESKAIENETASGMVIGALSALVLLTPDARKASNASVFFGALSGACLVNLGYRPTSPEFLIMVILLLAIDKLGQ